MKLVYIICILLTATISCFATDNAGTIQSTDQQATGLANITTVPSGKPSSPTLAVTPSVANNQNDTNKTSNTNVGTIIDNTNAIVAPTIANVTTTVIAQSSNDTPGTTTKTTEPSISTVTKSTVSTATTKNDTPGTAINTTEPSISTVTKPTVSTATIKNDTRGITTKTTEPSISTVTKPTVSTATTKMPPATNKVNTSNVSETTAIPVSTKVAPSSTERHFDGLSFLGGITLTTCLMAIGALSWKFYRTFPTPDYRTL